MKSTEEILQESRALRNEMLSAGTKANTSSTNLGWHYYFGQVLGAVGTVFRDFVWHVYFPDIDSIWALHTSEEPPDTMTVIIHGHSRGGFCCANTCCHVLGYKPDGPLPSGLQKQWEKFGYGNSV